MSFANTRMASGDDVNAQSQSASASKVETEGWLNESISLRELNRVSLSMVTLDGEELNYEAYMDGGFSTDINIPMQDFSADPSMKLTALTNIFGFAPAFDMPRYFMFKGSQPLKFGLSTYLKADSSKEQQNTSGVTILTNYYQKPLENLFKMCLPLTSKESLADISVVRAVGDLLSGIPIFGDGNSVTARLDEVRLMNVPESISPKLNPKNRIKLRMGKSEEGWAMEFRDIIITNIRLSWGKLILDKGYPDRIEVDLTIETLRSATTDLIKNFLIGIE